MTLNFVFNILLVLCSLLFNFCLALPEQGVWLKRLNTKPSEDMASLMKIQERTSISLSSYAKIMYNNTSISTTINCKSTKGTTNFEVEWILRISDCADDFYNMNPEKEKYYFLKPGSSPEPSLESNPIVYRKSLKKTFKCNGNSISLPNDMEGQLISVYTSVQNSTNLPTKTNRGRREAIATKATSPTIAATTASNIARSSIATNTDSSDAMTQTWGLGAYLYLIFIRCTTKDCDFTATVHVTMSTEKGYGYLSAIEWPFLVFYGVMSLVYLLFGILWLIFSACYWRDLLRVQFWIGAVIMLGMLEKAFFYAEYHSINSTGKSLPGSVVFAEIVSCMKRTLARLLVMVVCIGYGIVKPRLGPALRKVVGIGVVYFICALVEGCIRVLHPRFERSKILLYALIPPVVVDGVICWWTFSYLIQTIKQMRLRRNMVKFNLYRHFSNILIIVILASVVFMVWSIYTIKLFPCKNWQNVWVDEAFWHILFSVILMVIIWLWRPSNNNQRYAYSPVLDADDMEDEDVLMDNMSTGDVRKKTSNGRDADKQKTKDKKASSTEDDLKWIEEHIPATAAEQVYPLLDSDEEITTSKIAASKMD